MKEEIKGDDELRAAFDGADTAAGVLAALEGSERGRRFVAERLRAHQQTLRLQGDLVARVRLQDVGRGPGADHRGDPRLPGDRLRLPVEHPGASATTSRQAKARGDGRRRGRAARATLQAALDRSLAMNPLTPDHHFYIDQGTNARLRLALIAIGRKLADAGVLADAEDVVFLRYNELRLLMADQSALRRAGARLRPPRRPRGRRRAPPAVVGRHRDARTALDVPVRVALGLPGEVPRRRAVDDRRGQGPRRVARRGRGHRPLRRLARRVRPGQARATSSCAG